MSRENVRNRCPRPVRGSSIIFRSGPGVDSLAMPTRSPASCKTLCVSNGKMSSSIRAQTSRLISSPPAGRSMRTYSRAAASGSGVERKRGMRFIHAGRSASCRQPASPTGASAIKNSVPGA